MSTRGAGAWGEHAGGWGLRLTQAAHLPAGRGAKLGEVAGVRSQVHTQASCCKWLTLATQPEVTPASNPAGGPKRPWPITSTSSPERPLLLARVTGGV